MSGKERSRRVRVGSVEVAYDEDGAGGRPLVLVHGFLGSRGDWGGVLPRLAPWGRTLALDLRGHGESSHGAADGYTLEQLGEDLIGFLDALGVQRCDLLGHCMGGYVATCVALARPERVASLLLVNATSRPLDGDVRKVYRAALQVARDAGLVAFFEVSRAAVHRALPIRPSIARSIERIGETAYWQRVREQLLAMDPLAFERLGTAFTENPGVADRLRDVRCPTTVIAGSEDAPFRAPCEALAAAIPGARLVVVPAAAHAPQIENPDAWLDAVSQHLRWARGDS